MLAAAAARKRRRPPGVQLQVTGQRDHDRPPLDFSLPPTLQPPSPPPNQAYENPPNGKIFKQGRPAAKRKLDQVPMALIIDSPWIPGLRRASKATWTSSSIPELWFQSHLKVHQEFVPDIILSWPGWWIGNTGMARREAVGARFSKIKVLAGPTRRAMYPMLFNIEDLDKYPE